MITSAFTCIGPYVILIIVKNADPIAYKEERRR